MKLLAEELRDKKYYNLAHQGSIDLQHPAMKVLLGLFRDSQNILDMGCGEGTRLKTLAKNSNKKQKKLTGIDVSAIAIKMAKAHNQSINFSVANLEKLPFKDDTFDLLYSAYVFEHLTNPQKVLHEAKRVLKKNGKLMIIAPNFGAPNRRSPNSKEGKLKKLVLGFINDFKPFLKESNSLNWRSVTPLKNSYTIDADTTVEPYLLTLIKHCQNLNFKVEYSSSNWAVDKPSPFQTVFKLLGKIGIYPFSYWGPHMAVVLKK